MSPKPDFTPNRCCIRRGHCEVVRAPLQLKVRDDDVDTVEVGAGWAEHVRKQGEATHRTATQRNAATGEDGESDVAMPSAEVVPSSIPVLLQTSSWC